MGDKYAACRNALRSIAIFSFTIFALNIYLLPLDSKLTEPDIASIVEIRKGHLRALTLEGRRRLHAAALTARETAPTDAWENLYSHVYPPTRPPTICISLHDGTYIEASEAAFARLTIEEIVHLKEGYKAVLPTNALHQLPPSPSTSSASVREESDSPATSPPPEHATPTRFRLDCTRQTIIFTYAGATTDSPSPPRETELHLRILPPAKLSYSQEDKATSLDIYSEIKDLTPAAAGRYTRTRNRRQFEEKRAKMALLGIPIPAAEISGIILIGLLTYMLAHLSSLQIWLKRDSGPPQDRTEGWIALVRISWIRLCARGIILAAPAGAIAVAIAADFHASALDWATDPNHMSTYNVDAIISHIAKAIGPSTLILVVILLIGDEGRKKMQELQDLADLGSETDNPPTPKIPAAEKTMSLMAKILYLAITTGFTIYLMSAKIHSQGWLYLGTITVTSGVLAALIAEIAGQRRKRNSWALIDAQLDIIFLLQQEDKSYGQLLYVVDDEVILENALSHLTSAGRITRVDETTWRFANDPLDSRAKPRQK